MSSGYSPPRGPADPATQAVSLRNRPQAPIGRKAGVRSDLAQDGTAAPGAPRREPPLPSVCRANLHYLELTIRNISKKSFPLSGQPARMQQRGARNRPKAAVKSGRRSGWRQARASGWRRQLFVRISDRKFLKTLLTNRTLKIFLKSYQCIC